MRIAKIIGGLGVALAISASLVATASYGQVPRARAQAQAAENFTLVMLPDTQYASESWPEVFRAQMQWVDDQQSASNIRYVLHVGDVVDNSDQQYQWDNSKSAMGLPADDVPYIIGPGNHDLDSTTTRAATRYNLNYPRATFTGLPSFGGTYPSTQNDNAYHTFTAGGVDWLVVALKYAPNDSEIAWANQVVSAHPKHNAILVTHAYQNGTTKDANGTKLWTNLVSRHANFRFTFSGHYVNAGVISQQGVNGNTVHQIQADYQSLSQRDPNSYMRVMTYNPTTDTLDVKTYSPYLNRYMTDAKNQFVLNNINPVSPATGSRTEFESGTCDGTIDSNQAGFSGTGFCNTSNMVGAAAQVTVSADTSGAAKLTFGYANGGSSDRPTTVSVNGTTVGTLPFPPTAAWTNWATTTVNVNLNAGNNTIRLSATTAGGAPNLDYVDVA
ncbi:carbohydrate-binding protein [Micromonospora sp. LZ34]